MSDGIGRTHREAGRIPEDRRDDQRAGRPSSSLDLPPPQGGGGRARAGGGARPTTAPPPRFYGVGGVPLAGSLVLCALVLLVA